MDNIERIEKVTDEVIACFLEGKIDDFDLLKFQNELIVLKSKAIKDDKNAKATLLRHQIRKIYEANNFYLHFLEVVKSVLSK